MEVSSLAMRYVPFLIFMVIGIAVIFDARIRLSRPNRAAWAAGVQAVVGAVMFICPIAAIVISPDVGVIDVTGVPELSSITTTTIYLAAACIAIVTLVIGLISPAAPQPRRGFTALALVLDGIATACCAFYVALPSPLP